LECVAFGLDGGAPPGEESGGWLKAARAEG
jgi:hypothetical protein